MNPANPSIKGRPTKYPAKRYGTVVLDFPWPQQQKGARGAVMKYPLMTEQQIADFPLPDLLEGNAHVWLWVTVASRYFAQTVAETRWGLTFRSELIWDKRKTGLGNYLRGSHESCLLFTKGKAPIRYRGQRDVADWPLQDHSHKPEEFLILAQRCSPGAYLECFSRARFPGFDHWGFEVPGGSDLFIPGYPVPHYSARASSPVAGSGDEWAEGVIRKAV